MIPKLRSWLLMGLAISTVIGALYGQRPFRQYPAVEYHDFPLPSDWRTPAERPSTTAAVVGAGAAVWIGARAFRIGP